MGQDPVFVLSPPRSYSTIACGMLGQHPQLYGLPEVHLFVGETLREMWGFYELPRRRHGRAGLLRAVAQLYAGRQTVRTVRLAERWVDARLPCSTGAVFAELAERAGDAILLDKSPVTVERAEYLARARRAFPEARFIHLLRHPRGMGESVLDMFGEAGLRLRDAVDYATDPPTPDPQRLWLTLHTNILMFLDGVPADRQYTVRGEDLLNDPDRQLAEIAGWLGLRTDPEAVEAMKHPERSPFASFGPVNARLGGDPKFLSDPALRPGRVTAHNLTDPLSWRSDGAGFSREVKDLARRFGYR